MEEAVKRPAESRLERQVRVPRQDHERLKLIIPLTLFTLFVLIYIKSLTKMAIVLLAVPFSLVGSFWRLYFMHYNMSIAVWVGIVVTSTILEFVIYPAIYMLWREWQLFGPERYEG